MSETEGRYSDEADSEEPVRSLETRGPVSMGASIGQAEAQEVAQEAPRMDRRGQGRRIRLVRDRDGQYIIFAGSRRVQSFCSEWEDITRFQMPMGIEQQVRIVVQELGPAREMRDENLEASRFQEERAERAQQVGLEPPRSFQVDRRMLEGISMRNEEAERYQIRGDGEPINPMDHAFNMVMEQLHREMERLREMMHMIERMR